MKRKKRRRRALTAVLLLVAAAAVLTADSNLRITASRYSISGERLPDGLDGFRVVQLSDLHGAEFGRDNARLIAAVRDSEPDIIAVTGDLIDEPAQLGYARSLMARLMVIAPVYYVTGNHEWASGAVRELFDLLDELGVTTLRNSYELIEKNGASMILAGIDDPNGPADMEKPPEVVARIREAEGDKYMLLLVHRNDWLENYSRLDVDAVLCGHAHGGIVRLPFTDGLIDTRMNWFPTHTCGLYSENGTDMIVSRGLGNTRPTFRVLNNPHIPVITLSKR